jgi:hypothetical protein
MASLTATVTTTIATTITKASSSASATSTNRATPQGGILEGGNPVVYSASNPIILFIIQVCFFFTALRNSRKYAHGVTRGCSCIVLCHKFRPSLDLDLQDVGSGRRRNSINTIILCG